MCSFWCVEERKTCSCLAFLKWQFSRLHIYVLINNIYFSIFDLLLSIHAHLCKWHSFVPSYGWVIFHCICMYHIMYIHTADSLRFTAETNATLECNYAPIKKWKFLYFDPMLLNLICSPTILFCIFYKNKKETSKFFYVLIVTLQNTYAVTMQGFSGSTWWVYCAFAFFLQPDLNENFRGIYIPYDQRWSSVICMNEL